LTSRNGGAPSTQQALHRPLPPPFTVRRTVGTARTLQHHAVATSVRAQAGGGSPPVMTLPNCFLRGRFDRGPSPPQWLERGWRRCCAAFASARSQIMSK